MLQIGDKAPEFCLPNQDSEEICLRDLRGSWVVLYFYPKDNTPGCTTEACDFTDALPDFVDMGAVVLGVSPDSIKKHQNFIAKKDLKITLLSDENKEVLDRYGVWQLKKKLWQRIYGSSAQYICDRSRRQHSRYMAKGTGQRTRRSGTREA